ncbi:MAG: glycosyltransferase [Flavobacteriales bacterium]
MSSRKKVLFLPEWYPNHVDPQLGVFVEKYARAVSKFHDVAVVYIYPSEVTDSRMEVTHDDFFLIKITYPKKKLTPLAARAYINHHKNAKEILFRDWGKPDLVHLHMLFRNFIAWDELYRWDCPNFVLTEQWSGYLTGAYEKLPLLKKKYYKSAFSQAKTITAVSKRLQEKLTALFNRNDIQVVPNIAERNEENKQQKPGGSSRLLVVADLVDEIKNVSGILNAYDKVELVNPSELVIIGDGIDRTKLESIAEKIISTNKKITFKGRLQNEDVLREMKTADFLVLNSRFETFSMVAAEALLSGIPVISSRCGGPEEFLNSSNSMLVDVDSVSQLSTAMAEMEKKRNTFDAQKLAEPVLQLFGIDAVGKRMSAIYNEIP